MSYKRTAVAAVAWVDASGRHHRQVRTFATATGDLERLRDWLAERGVADHENLPHNDHFDHRVFVDIAARAVTPCS